MWILRKSGYYVPHSPPKMCKYLKQETNMIKDFYKKIKNLVVKTARYAVICWKNGGDHDWDFAYLYYILQWKLDRMAACIEKNDITTRTNVTVRQIKYASYLIERITSDYDYEEMMKTHTAKWGDLNMDFESIGNNMSKTVFSWSKANTPEEEKQADAECKEVFTRSRDKKIEMKTRLFKHIDKYIENWWD